MTTDQRPAFDYFPSRSKMALKSAARIQRATGRTTDAMLAALPSVASVRPVATLRSSTAFTSSQPIARSAFRSSVASRGLSVKVAAVNGPGLSVDLRGKHWAYYCGHPRLSTC